MSLMPVCIVNPLNVGHLIAADLQIHHITSTLGKIRAGEIQFAHFQNMCSIIRVFFKQSVAEVPLTTETFSPSVQSRRTRCGSSIVQNLLDFSLASILAQSPVSFLLWSFVAHHCAASSPRPLIVVARPSILHFPNFLTRL